MDFNQRTYAYTDSQRLAAVVLTTTAKTLYQAPQDTPFHITQMIVFNHGGGSATFTLHHVARNETPTTANALYYQSTLSSKTGSPSATLSTSTGASRGPVTSGRIRVW